MTVPVKLDIEPAATKVGALDFEFFDASRLTIDVPGGISAGADTASGWAISATVVAAGHLRVGMLNSRGRPLATGLREIARLQFRVKAGVGSAALRRLGDDRLKPALRTPVSERPVHVGEQILALDIEPVDSHAGGYLWTAADGSLAVAGRKPMVFDRLSAQDAAVAEGDLRAAVAEAPLADAPRDQLFADMADDVVQECVYRLLKRAASYDLPRDGSRLLFRAVTNECLNRTTRGPDMLSLDAVDDDAQPLGSTLADPHADQPLDIVLTDELRQVLDEALDQLPVAQRAALELKSLGHSLEEIAAALSVTANHAGVLVHRARRAVRERMARYG